MIGKCPNCGIGLKEPPFNDRETNEVVITLKYRDFVDNGKPMASIERAGYCEICDAKLKDLESQKEIRN